MFCEVKYGPVAPSSHFEIRVKPIQPEAGQIKPTVKPSEILLYM